MLEQAPFTRESAVQAFLSEHPVVFSFNGVYDNPDVIETEVVLDKTKHRMDLLVALDQETLGIVEIKLGTFTKGDLKSQLVEKYLVKKDEIVKKVINWEYFDEVTKVIGICVGERIDFPLQNDLIQGMLVPVENTKEKIPVLAMAVQRFRSKTTHDTYITVDTFGLLETGRDYTKYDFGDLKRLGKGRLVWNVIIHYAITHPGITLNDLRTVFPQDLVQGSRPMFLTLQEIKDQKRYFVKPDELFHLKDGQFALTTQSWSGKNFEKFLVHVRTHLNKGEIPPIKVST